MPKYSIILPVKNGGEYVKTCVAGILSQSFTGFTLEVLDNCSTDGTAEWIQSLNDSRIRCYPAEKPLSIEDNWARIKSIPKNEFMTMIGHDDVLLPHYLMVMNELIMQHPNASLYQAHYDYIDASGNFIRPCMPMDEVQYAHEFLACQMARTMESMGTGYMMRSKDYDLLGGMPQHYPNLIFADYELWVNLTRSGYKATTVRQCFQYRLHQNISRTTNGVQYQEAFGKYMQFIKQMMQEDARIKEVVTRYGRAMLLYFCESLSHRLLKTPARSRSMTVAAFIDRCKTYASELIPGQDFDPVKIGRINIAMQLDRSAIGRGAFALVKKLMP